MTVKSNFDVTIIGGSYAGLSAALALGRSLRSVLIIDSGSPCNRQTPHSQNFLTQDGQQPAAIARKAKRQALNYNTIHFHKGIAVSAEKTKEDFLVSTDVGNKFNSKKLIVATGIKDVIPTIKGFSECWGISVIHCPYCHGYEFRKCRTGIMANGERAMHIVSLVHNLTKDITILTSGKADFTIEQLARLNKRNIKIIESRIIQIEHTNGYIRKVVFDDDNSMALETLYAAIPFTQHSNIPLAMGCELTPQGHIKTDMFQKTTVPGVFACGDNASMMRSLASAISTGNIAGAMTNSEIAAEEF